MGICSDDYERKSDINDESRSRNSSKDRRSEDNRSEQNKNNDNKKEFDLGFHNNDNDNKKEFGFGFHNNDNDRNNDKNDNDFYNNIHDHKDFGDNERMFNNLDRNNNSVLSRNEIMDGFNLNSRQADELMDKMDENRDGYINKEEFNNYMNNNFENRIYIFH